MAAPTDPLVKVIMDPKAIEISSTLIAKLEYVSYGDNPRRPVFKTTWGADLFKACTKRIGMPPDFDIDVWYLQVRRQGGSSPSDKIYAPHIVAQPIQTNWLVSLFEMEVKHPGFMSVLHNILDLEDKTYEKLALQSTNEEGYDFLGVRNPPSHLLQGSSQHKLIK